MKFQVVVGEVDRSVIDPTSTSLSLPTSAESSLAVQTTLLFIDRSPRELETSTGCEFRSVGVINGIHIVYAC